MPLRKQHVATSEFTEPTLLTGQKQNPRISSGIPPFSICMNMYERFMTWQLASFDLVSTGPIHHCRSFRKLKSVKRSASSWESKLYSRLYTAKRYKSFGRAQDGKRHHHDNCPKKCKWRSCNTLLKGISFPYSFDVHWAHIPTQGRCGWMLYTAEVWSWKRQVRWCVMLFSCAGWYGVHVWACGWTTKLPRRIAKGWASEGRSLYRLES